MAIAAPTIIRANNLLWSVKGQPYQRKTTITLLRQGQYGNTLSKHRDILDFAALCLVDALRRNAPVDTGMLRASIMAEPGSPGMVSLGPPKFDRYNMKRALAGKPLRGQSPRSPKRRRGRPRLQGFYALPANRRSRQPAYIENSIRECSHQVERRARETQENERALAQIQKDLAVIRQLQAAGMPMRGTARAMITSRSAQARVRRDRLPRIRQRPRLLR